MAGDPNGGVGSVVTYKCNANYKLVGSAERKCLTPNSQSRREKRGFGVTHPVLPTMVALYVMYIFEFLQ